MSTTSAVARATNHLSSAVFVSLVDGREKFALVSKIFTELFDPFYGSQPAVLKDIEERRERKTEILTHEGRDVGCISYRRDLTNALADEGITECLEVTLISLFDPERDMGSGYRSLLLERIDAAAKIAQAHGICYRVPKKLSECIQYFEHRNYKSKELRSMGEPQECILYKTLQKRRRIEEDEEKVTRPPPSVQSSKASQSNKAAIHLAPGSHQLTLKKPYINPIRSGAKSIEGRINSGAPSKFKVGDKLRFFYPQNESDDVTCTISKIERYDGFREMLEATDYKKCIPEARSLDEAFNVYQRIPGYMDRARQNGVLALYLVKQ